MRLPTRRRDLCLAAPAAFIFAAAFAAGAEAPSSDAGPRPVAADAPAAVQAAWTSFLDGDLDGASSSFRYLATLGIAAPDPDVNLAVLARDLGRPDEAVTYWTKASLEAGAGGFVFNQRGWAYAAIARLPEAREAFLKGLDRSSTTAEQAEAQLGLGMVARMGVQPRQALVPLRALLEQNPFASSSVMKSPYIMAAASYEAARAALSAGDKYAAMAYLRQCVNLDAWNLECLGALAELEARVGENRAAWYSYLRVLALDPANEQAQRQARRLREFITGDPQNSLPIRRLSRPLLPPQS